MNDKVLAFDMGLRKETKSKFTGPDYSVDSKPVAIDGNNLCGGTPNSTKAGGTGESLGMSTQKPIMERLICGEIGTVEMEKNGYKGLDPKKHAVALTDPSEKFEEAATRVERRGDEKRPIGKTRHELGSRRKSLIEGGIKDVKHPEGDYPEHIRSSIEDTFVSERPISDLKQRKAGKRFERRAERGY